MGETPSPLKRARRRQAAVRATISTYHDAVLTRGGVFLIRSGEATFLNDDEMDRLAGEWARVPIGASGGGQGVSACLHRWILMSEWVERVNAYTKQRRRRFYCERCREVVEDRDKAFAG